MIDRIPSVFDRALQRLQRKRARAKAERIAPWIPPHATTLLDVGTGEGYVAEALGARIPRLHATLTDTLDYNHTALPFVAALPDGTLPFDDDHFDVAVLYFVLHHAENTEALLDEVCRVSRRVIIAESVYIGAFQRRLLRVLDQAANALRSRGRMDPYLHHRTAAEWRTLFESSGLSLLAEFQRGRFIHRQAYFCIEPDELALIQTANRSVR